MPSYEPSESDLAEMWEEAAEENGFDVSGPEWGVWRQAEARGTSSLSDRQRAIYDARIRPLLRKRYEQREAVFRQDLIDRDTPA